MSEEVKPATCEWCKRYITRHLDAYYYGFSATGVIEIDNILCSVASAGKAYHSTEDWSEGGYPELIQKAASEAAARLDAERALNAKLREGLARYQHGAAQRHIDDIATIESLRALNAEMLKFVRVLAEVRADPCQFCKGKRQAHFAGCPVTEAQAIIAKAEGKAQ